LYRRGISHVQFSESGESRELWPNSTLSAARVSGGFPPLICWPLRGSIPPSQNKGLSEKTQADQTRVLGGVL